MIAANLRKHPDAMLRQLELELISTGGTATQHAAWKTWLIATCTVQSITRQVPAWYRAMKKKARELARAVKAKILDLFTEQTPAPFGFSVTSRL